MAGRLIPGLLGLLVGWLPAQEVPKAVPFIDPGEVAPDGEVPAAPMVIEEPVVDERQRAERSVSRSGQFIVYGGDSVQRGTVAIQADVIRDEFFAVMGVTALPNVKVPIEILLVGKPGDEARQRPVAFELRFTDENFLLQIHVDLARGLNRELMERAVLKGLLCERALRGKKPNEFDESLQVPVWLVEGLREAELWRVNRADRNLYSGVFKQKSLFTLEELFAMDEDKHRWLDGVSREAFRALSGAMVMALLEQPRGREAFVDFSNEVAAYGGDLPILMRKHFPELNLSDRSLAKWWALTMAKLADVPLTEVMGIEVTDEALGELLYFNYRDEQGINHRTPLVNWETVGGLDEEERLEAVRPAQDGMNRLSYRCFPSYRPLLKDYQEVLLDWAGNRKLGGLDERLAELEETRMIMRERASLAAHYLNWREIVEAGELSGEFEDYLRITEDLKERPRKPRTDPISSYLDTLQRAYGGSEGEK